MYRAIINGITFFDTSIDDDRYTLLSANVTKQKGGSGQFVFTVPCCNACYGMFGDISDYVDLYRDDETDPFFFGRVYSTNRRFDNALEVVCEGMLSVLCDSIFDPITHDGNLHALVQLLLNSHNSQVEAAKRIYVGTLYVDNDACYRAYENYETTWERFEDLLQSFGGFLYLYRQNGTMYIDWKKTCDTGSTQKVDFGENLIDVQKYQNSNLICTVLTPLGIADKDNKRLDISSVNAGSKELYADEEYIEKYGYIHKVQIWDDVTVASNLKSKGQSYMESCLAEQYTISITAVDLADAGYDLDHFDVGQKLKVTSIPNGIDGVFFDVNLLSKNLFSPENDTLSIGTEFVGYIKMQNNAVRDITMDLEKNYPTKSAVESATQLITGNHGGYVVMHDGDGDGFPDEILVMDTPDIDTAQKVWRWNNSGLGYSNTGYNGTFGLAMTINGQIIANYINSGELSADRIQGGTLKLGGVGNANGSLTMYNASNNVIGTWDNNGINVTKLEAEQNVYVDGNQGSLIRIPVWALYTVAGHPNFTQLYKFGLKNHTYGTYVHIGGIEAMDEHIYTPSGFVVSNFEFLDDWNASNSQHVDISVNSIYMASGGSERFFVGYGDVRAAGNVTVNGNLTVRGTSKQRTVKTKDYSERSLYCYETTSPFFGDIGEGVIGEDGKCYITVDPIFSETIMPNMQVFLQQYGEGECWVDEINNSYFVVIGTPNLKFAWEIKSKQIDSDSNRLVIYSENLFKNEVKAPFLNSPVKVDYAEELEKHIEEIKRERQVA